MVTAIKDRFYVVIKEPVDGKDEPELIGQSDVKMPVKSVDETVSTTFNTLVIERGAPDVAVNLTPKKFPADEFKKWLDYRCIQYRELEADTSDVQKPVWNVSKPLETLSSWIDFYLQEGGE